MKLELNHFFILVEPEAKVAERLVEMGMLEGTGNIHEGQGTSNRRFYFSNGMLEFLWVHDAAEAVNGPGREMHFPERATNPIASPFGVILHRKDNTTLEMPFEGWKYQPDYFEPPWAFHVGANSSNLLEPLCFYVPFLEPKPATSNTKPEEGIFKSISKVHIYTPSEPLSNVLAVVDSAERLSIEHGETHLMEVTFDEHRHGRSRDLRPDIPLIIHW